MRDKRRYAERRIMPVRLFHWLDRLQSTASRGFGIALGGEPIRGGRKIPCSSRLSRINISEESRLTAFDTVLKLASLEAAAEAYGRFVLCSVE